MLDEANSTKFLKYKRILNVIRKELEKLYKNRDSANELAVEIEEIKNFLSITNKINSKLSILIKNTEQLEEYITILQEYSENLTHIENIEEANTYSKPYIIESIKKFLVNLNNRFIRLNFDKVLATVVKNEVVKHRIGLIQLLDTNNHDLLGDINLEKIDQFEKIDQELAIFINESKEVINHFEPIINDYRNNVQMLPVFNAAKRNIEKSLISYINDKKSEIDLHFNALKDEIESNKNNLILLNKELNNIKKIHSDINKDQSELFIKNLNLSKGINDTKLNLEKTKTELNLEIEEKIRKTNKYFNERFNERLISLDKELNDVNKIINEEVLSIKDTSKSFKDFISDETSIKLTNDYKNKADREMYSYYFFNGLSIIIIVVAIVLSWHSLNNFSEAHIGEAKNYDRYDLAYLSIRLVFSLIIFSSIAFTSKLASKSYIYWKKNEGIFLRLTALKSFIADMSIEKKQEIHEKLVDVYFGKDESENNPNHKIKDLPNNITQLLSKVVEHSSSILDSKKDTKESKEH